MFIDKVKLTTGVVLEFSLSGPIGADTLLFVHGLGPNLRQFADQEEYFSREYQVLLVSLRGHGRSSCPEHPSPALFSLNQYARDLRALLALLEIDKVHYIGSSMGGLVGYELLDMDETLFASLTTFGTAAEMHESFLRMWTLNRLTHMLGSVRLGQLSGITTDDKKVAHRVAQMFSSANCTCLELTQRHIADYDYTGVLMGHALPMLVIMAEDDQEVNPYLASTLAAAAEKPDFHLVELEGVGHFANMENPGAFNMALQGFLREAKEELPYLVPEDA
jgi:3-oxoadipate enol-lactonase